MSTLNEKDLYGILLYAIYKCTGNPKYSTLSELVYTLDKDSLLKLLAVFGGCTIELPTLELFKHYLNALFIYLKVYEGERFSDVVNKLGLNKKLLSYTIDIYNTLCDVIKEYEQKHSNTNE